jgi:hypothetical protein
VFPPPALLVGFLSPFTFFHCFFFPSSCWVAFEFVDCTLCISNVWVGGAAEPVVWLDVVSCIDNLYNWFDIWSMGFICAEPKISSACGPYLYLVLSSIDHDASDKTS